MTIEVDEALLAGVLEGDVVSVARAITALENARERHAELGEAVWRNGGHADVVGVTGPPGSGKSTLVNALAVELRGRGERVGIVAVDPSSALSGGAILGDRIRMGDHTRDRGVYVRSLSSRGSLGGVSRATVDAVAVLDAAGFDTVIVETVGVGQADVDIVRIAETVLLVSVPGLGDEVQAIKAGLIELADVHVVNKADRPDANRLVVELKTMLSLGRLDPDAWAVPVVETVATAGTDVDAVVDAVEAHQRWLRSGDRMAARRRRSMEARVQEVAKELVVRRLQGPAAGESYRRVIDAVVAREMSPYSAAHALSTTPELETI